MDTRPCFTCLRGGGHLGRHLPIIRADPHDPSEHVFSDQHPGVVLHLPRIHPVRHLARHDDDPDVNRLVDRAPSPWSATSPSATRSTVQESVQYQR